MSDKDMAMTKTNGIQDKDIFSNFSKLFHAYEGLCSFLDSSQPEHALFEVLNDQFRAALDEADEAGLMP